MGVFLPCFGVLVLIVLDCLCLVLAVIYLPFLKFAHLDLGRFVTSQLVVSERIK